MQEPINLLHSIVLPETSTTTPPSVLNQELTDKEQELLSRLLINLFLENPRRTHQSKQESQKETPKKQAIPGRRAQKHQEGEKQHGRLA